MARKRANSVPNDRERVLPERIAPMLAKAREAPFDSDDHLFEIKWDGTRCVAFVESSDPDSLRLQNRRYFEMRTRYPEFACLAGLPAGTVLDAEIVVLEDGKPNFNRLMQRDHISDAKRVAMLAKRIPATMMAFDLLYDGGKSIMSQPLTERRGRLEKLIAELGNQHVIVPSYVVGAGQRYFAGAEQLGLEGVMAKRLASRYQPGQRSEDWVKVKVATIEPFHIIGFTQREGQRVISALVIAMRQGRRWILKGKVGTGFTEHQRGEFYEALVDAPPLSKPPKDGPADAQWRDTGLICNVRYFEKTVTGQLRGPVFEGLVQSERDD